MSPLMVLKKIPELFAIYDVLGHDNCNRFIECSAIIKNMIFKDEIDKVSIV